MTRLAGRIVNGPAGSTVRVAGWQPTRLGRRGRRRQGPALAEKVQKDNFLHDLFIRSTWPGSDSLRCGGGGKTSLCSSSTSCSQTGTLGRPDRGFDPLQRQLLQGDSIGVRQSRKSDSASLFVTVDVIRE